MEKGQKNYWIRILIYLILGIIFVSLPIYEIDLLWRLSIVFIIVFIDIINTLFLVPKIFRCPNCGNEMKVASISGWGAILTSPLLAKELYCAKCKRYYNIYRKKDMDNFHNEYTKGMTIALLFLFFYEFLLIVLTIAITSFIFFEPLMSILFLFTFRIVLFFCIPSVIIGIPLIVKEKKLKGILLAVIIIALLVLSYTAFTNYCFYLIENSKTVEQKDYLLAFLSGIVFYISCLYPTYHFILWVNKRFKGFFSF